MCVDVFEVMNFQCVLCPDLCHCRLLFCQYQCMDFGLKGCWCQGELMSCSRVDIPGWVSYYLRCGNHGMHLVLLMVIWRLKVTIKSVVAWDCKMVEFSTNLASWTSATTHFISAIATMSPCSGTKLKTALLTTMIFRCWFWLRRCCSS